MSENTENIKLEAEFTEETSQAYSPTAERGSLSLLLPAVLTIVLMLGVIKSSQSEGVDGGLNKSLTSKFELDTVNMPSLEAAALIAPEEYSSKLRDTMYTNQDKWLELRIDEQKLYIHYKDGKTKTYMVSTGNKHASKSVESRPGIFAIFLKEEVHLSSQFNNARMNYFMPYNMGIGFHGLPGTGYYGHLGVRPSSHGCIRMRNEDVKTLFNECEVGTLVLAHHGKSARVVAFAPEGFKNERDYKSEDYMKMLAYNMNAIYEGKYLYHTPKRFIIDGKLIPRNGFNVGSTDDIPEKQIIPVYFGKYIVKSDYINENIIDIRTVSETLEPQFADDLEIKDEKLIEGDVMIDEETVKKLGFNKVGILPYFPPNR